MPWIVRFKLKKYLIVESKLSIHRIGTLNDEGGHFRAPLLSPFGRRRGVF